MMHRTLALAVTMSLSLPVAVRAQAVTAPAPAARPANDSLFRRARKLVSEGNGVAGRALADSLLAAAAPGTAEYGNALYWRGALAQTAADAERDYRRVIVEYPLAYYADDALLALAELEQARGDRASAMQHLQRFVREHPASSARGIAALGAARLAFEQRDTKTGCAMLGEARASAGAGDVELRNQVDYYAGRCPDLAAASAAPAVAAAAAAPVAAAPAAPVAAAPVSVAAESVSASAAPTAPAPASAAAVSVAAVSVAPVHAKPAHSAATKPATARRSGVMTHRSGVMTRRAEHARYTIQLAAFNTRAEADHFIAKLKARQLSARVSGTTKPFRVRLGFYPTRSAAQAEVSSLKARGIIGFATEEP